MMREPQRLLESESELNALERRLLRSASRTAPPTAAKRAIWLAIAGKVSVAAAGASAGTVTYSGLLLTVVKSAGVGVLLGAAAIASVEGLGALRAPAAEPSQANARVAATARSPRLVPAKTKAEPVAPLESSEHATASKRVERSTVVSNAASNLQRVSAAPSTALGSSSQSNHNAEANSASPEREALALASARARLRGGDAAASLTQLSALERDFPRGLLVQERDALTIEALRATGQLALARARAAAFLARFPGSPHAESARRVLAE